MRLILKWLNSIKCDCGYFSCSGRCSESWGGQLHFRLRHWKTILSKTTVLRRKKLVRQFWTESPTADHSMPEAHISSTVLDSSEVYISVFPAFLTDSCWLQAVEWQCDEATKRACYSKGKSKVSMTQLLCFNRIYVLIAGVIQFINLYLMHFYCLPFQRDCRKGV